VWKTAGLHGNAVFPLERFSYNNSALLNVIFKQVQDTNFRGITVSGKGMDSVQWKNLEGREFGGEGEAEQAKTKKPYWEEDWWSDGR